MTARTKEDIWRAKLAPFQSISSKRIHRRLSAVEITNTICESVLTNLTKGHEKAGLQHRLSHTILQYPPYTSLWLPISWSMSIGSQPQSEWVAAKLSIDQGDYVKTLAPGKLLFFNAHRMVVMLMCLPSIHVLGVSLES